MVCIGLWTSCSHLAKEEEKISTSDAAHAIELTWDQLYTTTDHPTGPGYFQEVAAVHEILEQEHNSIWYRITVPKEAAGANLIFRLEPQQGDEDYDFLLYQTDDAVAFFDALQNGSVRPVRGNVAFNNSIHENVTGLSCQALHPFEDAESHHTFSSAVPLKGGETFFLLVDSPLMGSKGYSLKFTDCSDVHEEVEQEATVALAESSASTPAVTASPAAAPKASKPGKGERYHTVSKDETIYSIARWYRMSIKDVESRNELSESLIYVGQKLVVRDVQPDYSRTAGRKTQPTSKSTTPLLASSENQQGHTPNAVTSSTLAKTGSSNTTKKGTSTATKAPAASETQPTPVEASEKEKEVVATPAEEQEEQSEPVALAPAKPEGKTYFLKLNVYNSRNSKPVETSAMVVSPLDGSPIGELEAFKTEALYLEKSKPRRNSVVIDKFGFRRTELDLDLDHLFNDTTLAAGSVFLNRDTIVLDQYIDRYRKGDINVMYNVFFHDDAAIMLVKSKYELTSLLELMQENDDVKIRIHGHTNGGGIGKIIVRNEDAHNFFYVNGTTKETTGSAKHLSQLRADIIRDYLVFNGISTDRIETVGWGGKRPVYDKKSTLAYKNKRVEVEVVEE